MGDCDFDASFCNYVSDIEQPINELNQNNLLITHKPKYASLNTNEYDVLNKAKDYYLSVLKANEKNGGSIYSPLIGLQKTTTKETAADTLKFNQKIYTLSFSYMIHNSSDNKISLVLLTNRSDAKVSIIQKEVLAEYSQKSLEFDKDVSLIDFRNDCPTFTIGSMLNSFILTNKEKKDRKIENAKRKAKEDAIAEAERDAKFLHFLLRGRRRRRKRRPQEASVFKKNRHPRRTRPRRQVRITMSRTTTNMTSA
jgi:hypothetical protein